MTKQTVRQESGKSDLKYNNYINIIDHKINNIYDLNDNIKRHY